MRPALETQITMVLQEGIPRLGSEASTLSAHRRGSLSTSHMNGIFPLSLDMMASTLWCVSTPVCRHRLMVSGTLRPRLFGCILNAFSPKSGVHPSVLAPSSTLKTKYSSFGTGRRLVTKAVSRLVQPRMFPFRTIHNCSLMLSRLAGMTGIKEIRLLPGGIIPTALATT